VPEIFPLAKASRITFGRPFAEARWIFPRRTSARNSVSLHTGYFPSGLTALDSLLPASPSGTVLGSSPQPPGFVNVPPVNLMVAVRINSLRSAKYRRSHHFLDILPPTRGAFTFYAWPDDLSPGEILTGRGPAVCCFADSLGGFGFHGPMRPPRARCAIPPFASICINALGPLERQYGCSRGICASDSHYSVGFPLLSAYQRAGDGPPLFPRGFILTHQPGQAQVPIIRP